MMDKDEIREESFYAISNCLEDLCTINILEEYETKIKGMFCALKHFAKTDEDEKEIAFIYEDYLSYMMDSNGKPIYDETIVDDEDIDSYKLEMTENLIDFLTLREKLGIKYLYGDVFKPRTEEEADYCEKAKEAIALIISNLEDDCVELDGMLEGAKE